MQRQELEHIIRAAAAITGADTFVVIGSQAIWAQVTDPPPELLVSIEADIFTWRSPEDANLIDGSIGEASTFHQTFGYYAHGVGPETAILPDGWRERLVPFKTTMTGNGTAYCLEIHDLAISKIIAGREKDLSYVGTLIRHKLVTNDLLLHRLKQTPVAIERRELAEARLQRLLPDIH